MILRGCLHTHTTCSDGKMTPQEVADAYESRGYDFIAFTDHDYLVTPQHLQEYNRVKTDMIIFEGIELTVFAKGYVHVNRITGDKEVLHIFNHIGEYQLSVEQVMDRIGMIKEMFPLDALEVTTKGFRAREFEDLPVPYPKLASDDSHSLVGIGRAWIEMDTKREKDSILRAIKKGEFWNCYL
jgi:hypothetical protein